ncbi:quinol monooxygenase YgiN [Stenotrophomonas maltophilia]|uniref:putative quinol monooxygenase n=1 Tax=Stenotrophomonas chelatiphaga TaxID=517011 RepID=UPI000F4B8DA4|nr:quinol monooxygenase YgiN [Stenotrophomonas chelatiphaga]ROQ40345.1 quinol monooxygenase YgiN [Stenotrophomonas maltophilia]
MNIPSAYICTFVIKPESVEAAREVLTTLDLESTKEPGCLYYHVLQSASDPNTFTSLDAWANESSLQAYARAEHVIRAVDAIGPHLATAPKFEPQYPAN